MLRRNLDLWVAAAVVGLGLALPWLTAPAGARAVIGLAVVVVCPGYAVMAALFPGRQLGWPERILFSLGLSLVTAILGAVALNLTTWGLETEILAGVFAGVTVAGSLAAAWRRRPFNAAASATPAQMPQPRTGWRQWLWLGLAGLLTVGAVTLARTTPPATGVLGYSLLWVTPVSRPPSPSIQLGMSSSELATTRYRLTLTFDGRLFLEVPEITLEPGGQWQRLIALPPQQPIRVVEAIVYRLDQPGTVYRRVTLLLNAPGT